MKKIRIILCLVLTYSFCFGGCGNPAQNSSPDSSVKDFSRQEESSKPNEDSKTEVSSKPEVGSKVEDSSKVEVSSKLEESSKAESSSAYEESSVAQESSAKEESSMPEESSQTEVSSTPEESSAPEESSVLSDQEQMLQAYREVIAELEAEHGTAYDGDWYRMGLCMAKLIDFDYDGIPELFCSYSPEGALAHDAFTYEDIIYGYRDGSATVLYSGRGSNYGTGVKPGLDFLIKEDQYYYVLTWGGLTEYWTLINGEYTLVFSAYKSIPPDQFRINDISVSEENYQAQLDEFIGDGIEERYTYYTEGSGMSIENHIRVSVDPI